MRDTTRPISVERLSMSTLNSRRANDHRKRSSSVRAKRTSLLDLMEGGNPSMNSPSPVSVMLNSQLEKRADSDRDLLADPYVKLLSILDAGVGVEDQEQTPGDAVQPDEMDAPAARSRSRLGSKSKLSSARPLRSREKERNVRRVRKNNSSDRSKLSPGRREIRRSTSTCRHRSYGSTRETRTTPWVDPITQEALLPEQIEQDLNLRDIGRKGRKVSVHDDMDKAKSKSKSIRVSSSSDRKMSKKERRSDRGSCKRRTRSTRKSSRQSSTADSSRTDPERDPYSEHPRQALQLNLMNPSETFTVTIEELEEASLPTSLMNSSRMLVVTNEELEEDSLPASAESRSEVLNKKHAGSVLKTAAKSLTKLLDRVSSTKSISSDGQSEHESGPRMDCRSEGELISVASSTRSSKAAKSLSSLLNRVASARSITGNDRSEYGASSDHCSLLGSPGQESGPRDYHSDGDVMSMSSSSRSFSIRLLEKLKKMPLHSTSLPGKKNNEEILDLNPGSLYNSGSVDNCEDSETGSVSGSEETCSVKCDFEESNDTSEKGTENDATSLPFVGCVESLLGGEEEEVDLVLNDEMEPRFDESSPVRSTSETNGVEIPNSDLIAELPLCTENVLDGKETDNLSLRTEYALISCHNSESDNCYSNSTLDVHTVDTSICQTAENTATVALVEPCRRDCYECTRAVGEIPEEVNAGRKDVDTINQDIEKVESAATVVPATALIEETVKVQEFNEGMHQKANDEQGSGSETSNKSNENNVENALSPPIIAEVQTVCTQSHAAVQVAGFQAPSDICEKSADSLESTFELTAKHPQDCKSGENPVEVVSQTSERQAITTDATFEPTIASDTPEGDKRMGLDTSLRDILIDNFNGLERRGQESGNCVGEDTNGDDSHAHDSQRSLNSQGYASDRSLARLVDEWHSSEQSEVGFQNSFNTTVSAERSLLSHFESAHQRKAISMSKGKKKLSLSKEARLGMMNDKETISCMYYGPYESIDEGGHKVPIIVIVQLSRDDKCFYFKVYEMVDVKGSNSRRLYRISGLSETGTSLEMIIPGLPYAQFEPTRIDRSSCLTMASDTLEGMTTEDGRFRFSISTTVS